MSKEKSALGRVPVPFQSPAERVDYRALLEASLATPFAGRRKPWHIVLIQDPAVLKELGRIIPELAMSRERDPNCAIMICGDRSVKKHLGALVADCYEATTSLLHTACCHSLQTEHGRFFPDPERAKRARELLGIPKHIVPFSVAAFEEDLDMAASSVADWVGIHMDSWE